MYQRYTALTHMHTNTHTSTHAYDGTLVKPRMVVKLEADYFLCFSFLLCLYLVPLVGLSLGPSLPATRHHDKVIYKYII